MTYDKHGHLCGMKLSQLSHQSALGGAPVGFSQPQGELRVIFQRPKLGGFAGFSDDSPVLKISRVAQLLNYGVLWGPSKTIGVSRIKEPRH